MTATVIQFAVQQMVCTSCGSEANASCNCGKAYLPKKSLAAKAIAANPQKSNRALAAEIGVDEATVRTARKARAEDSAPEREGRDGKTYRMPVRDDDDDAAEPTTAEVVAGRFKEGAEDVIDTAQLALGFIKRMKFSKESVSACIVMVDRITAEWSAVKAALQKKGDLL